MRDDLRLGDAPLDDLPALCEQRLGVAVTRAQISTEGLRAASILDAERAAAAAVLSMDDLELSNNPRLTRVCLAHELCHLLFDPTKPGSVQVALDDADSATRTAKPSPGALLESRAKGFAAEFLIPHRGVSALLGGRADATSDRTEARQRVSLVREHFDTPWKIASLHLGNLGWIDRGLAQQMGDEGAGGGVSRPLSSLLCDDETPLLAQKLLATHPLDASLPADVLTRDDPPAWLDGVRATAAANARAALDLCLARAREALRAGRPRAAAFAVGERLDDYLLDADWPAAAALLDAIDVTEFPPAVLTAALVATRPVPDALQRTRTAFFGRAIEAMRARGALSEAELADIESRLR
ncbi:MAG: ImmA/IrrE family metallo-endopeptidase [Polyangiales bacterium]